MAKFDTGEAVYVPAACLSEPDDQPFALMARTVLDQRKRKVVVDDAGGETIEVATSKVHSKRLAFLVVRIGDFLHGDHPARSASKLRAPVPPFVTPRRSRAPAVGSHDG